jgi:P-type Ca2+ transporter type 2C
MIITDDNFNSIVEAIEHGRIIYRNIQRFIHYLFSCNLSEILTVFVAILIGWPLPLTALQILWLNIITDIFPALALALEPSSGDAMKRPPRDPKERLVPLGFAILIGWQGAVLAAFTLFAFWLGLQKEDAAAAGTIAFMTLALGQTIHAFNVRSRIESAFGAGFFRNGWLWSALGLCVLLQMIALFVPFLRNVLHLELLSAREWLIVGLCSLAPVFVVEAIKLLQRVRVK